MQLSPKLGGKRGIVYEHQLSFNISSYYIKKLQLLDLGAASGSLLQFCFAPLDSVSHKILNLSLCSNIWYCFLFFFKSLTRYRFSAVNNRSEGLDLEDCISSLFSFASIFVIGCY